MTLSPAELRTLAEYVEHGSMKEAATCAGVSYYTIHRQLADAYDRTGSRGVIDLLKHLGWLAIPDNARRHIEIAPGVTLDADIWGRE